MTLKNRGRSKKTEGRTGPKSRGGSLAVGTYLQRGSDPPGIAYSGEQGGGGGSGGGGDLEDKYHEDVYKSMTIVSRKRGLCDLGDP